MWFSRLNSILEFLGRKGESFRCSDLWDRLGGQALGYGWSMVLKATINQS